MEVLIDKYFGNIYQNYLRSKKCLVRQARDLLVCEYRGCLTRFENEFCCQASKLLQFLKVSLFIVLVFCIKCIDILQRLIGGLLRIRVASLELGSDAKQVVSVIFENL